jgi:PadR family transcriptional regulator PadR
MDITPWQSQLRKGAAELVILSILSGGERYGLQILEEANRGGEIVTEGALYPLLTRLERDAKLTSRWVVEDAPHPRKYYQLTQDGSAQLSVMVEAWISFRLAMTQVVETAR